MLRFLKRHPFAVEAHFKQSLVLTFAVPKASIASLIPSFLELDTFHDRYAFIAIALVETAALRPKGFPRFLGQNFNLIGYRVFVRYTNSAGKRLRGLYILKSETDKKRMEFAGNIFTHNNYTTTDISKVQNNDLLKVHSLKSKFSFTVDYSHQEVSLPPNSPFDNWKEARKFAGPMPYTFTYDVASKKILSIQGVRKNWKPLPIHIPEFYFDFITGFQLKDCVLANAFEVKKVDYLWKKGTVEQWK